MNSELRKAKNLSDKHLMLFLLMNEWVKIKQKEKSLSDLLKMKGYKGVSIYGMSYVGQRLFDEIIDSEIEIVGCIDKKGGGKYRGKEIVPIDRIHKESDAIIVTPIFFFDEIKESLEKITNADIISVEELIYSLSETEKNE